MTTYAKTVTQAIDTLEFKVLPSLDKSITKVNKVTESYKRTLEILQNRKSNQTK